MQFQYLYETTGLTGVVLSVVWYILILATGWKMYEKANEPGWKSIIPIYNTYTCYKFTWDTKIFWIYILCTALGEVLPSLLGSLVSLAATVLMIVQLYKLSKAFGHGVGFTVGLFFLRPIFLLILGFGGSVYLGKQD